MSASAAGAVIPQRPCVLVLAGLDPSGGAGLVADAQAVAAQGAHALTVCTALTVQDNDRVYGVHPVVAALVLAQIRSLSAKIRISAIKIGIPGSAANARAIAEAIHDLRRSQPDLPVVLDPVLASGHGDLLSRDDALAALAPLLALATVMTPNGPEARALTGAATAQQQAAALQARGCRHVLITGGHDGGELLINRGFVQEDRDCQKGQHEQPALEWRWPRLDGAFHGSGCTLASAIAGLLAMGAPLLTALEQAQHYCFKALHAAYAVAPGQAMPLR